MVLKQVARGWSVSLSADEKSVYAIRFVILGSACRQAGLTRDPEQSKNTGFPIKTSGMTEKS